MHSSAWWLIGAAVATLAACGGKVVVDDAGGAGGSGGATSSSSSSASSTTSASSSASSSSTSSSSTSASSSTGGLTCPDPFPGIFAECQQEGQQCAVPLSCCGGLAVCKGGFWQFLAPLCDGPCAPDCGPDGFACEPGALCVAYIGPVTTYQCSANPCFEGLSCGCVWSLCDAQGMTCNNIQDDYKVLCD